MLWLGPGQTLYSSYNYILYIIIIYIQYIIININFFINIILNKYDDIISLLYIIVLAWLGRFNMTGKTARVLEGTCVQCASE